MIRTRSDQDAALYGLGFRRNDEASWSKNGFQLTLDGAWAEVRAAAATDRPDAIHDELGRPGLWRAIDGARVFDLPPMPLLDDPLEDGPESDPLAAGVAWALRTASGDPVPGWKPPPREEVEAVVGGGSFSIRSRTHVTLGALLHEPDRLTLRVPAIGRVPEDLPTSRRRWLEEVVLDARRRFRLVRLGLADETVQAEVDLTGAPHARLDALCRIAVDSLRWVVARILPSVSVILDSGRRSEVLDRDPARVFSAPRGC